MLNKQILNVVNRGKKLDIVINTDNKISVTR